MISISKNARSEDRSGLEEITQIEILKMQNSSFLKELSIFEEYCSLEEEERILECGPISLKYQAGNSHAFNQIMENLVFYTPRIIQCQYNRVKFRKWRKLSKDDIENCVLRGIWKTAKYWKPEFDTSFKTYLFYKVRGQISLFDRQTYGNSNNKYKIRTETLSSKDPDKSDRHEFIDSGTPLPESQSREFEFPKEKVEKIMGMVYETDKEITYLRYGRGLTLEQVGGIVNLSRERVRQILIRIGKGLKKGIEKYCSYDEGEEVDYKVFLIGVKNWYENESLDSLNNNPESDIREKYENYCKGKLEYRKKNRLEVPDEGIIIPTIDEIVEFATTSKTPFNSLSKRGLIHFMKKNGGIGKIVRDASPGSVYKMKNTSRRWNLGDESVKFALEAIKDALYTIPDYQLAEESRNRTQQVKILNKLIKTTPLINFFNEQGLEGLMKNFYDPKGKKGFLKKSSPKAVLKFYNQYLGQDWFGRSKNCYVQSWRIRENNFWNQKEKSRIPRLMAIADSLYTLCDYKKYEKNHDRTMQLTTLDKELFQKVGSLRKWFEEQGLRGLMSGAIDPEGIYAPKKKGSPEALIRFYDPYRGYDWFDNELFPRIEVVGRGRLIVVKGNTL